jgi:hypothetical protein
MISVASEKKDARDDMVCEHLPMIFSPLFDIDNHNLLEPKGELREYIPFQETIYLSIWPIGPDSFDVEPVIGFIHNVLLSSQRSRRVGACQEDICSPSQATRTPCNISKAKLALRILSGHSPSQCRTISPEV